MSFQPSGGNVEVTGVLKVQVRKASVLKKIESKNQRIKQRKQKFADGKHSGK